MNGMVGTALLTKIAQTLSNNKTGQVTIFLPLAEGWDMKELSFDLPTDVTGFSERESLDLRGTFARRVNSTPVASDIWSNSGTYLWDIYRNVLEGSVVFGKLEEAPRNQNRIESARAIIGPPNSPTQKYQTYLLHRDKCRALEQSVHQADITLAHTTNPTLKNLAQDEHNRYQSQLDEANQEWIVGGYKAEIEEAIYILASAFTSSPVIQWNRWKNDFSLVFQQTDSSGEFWPTGYRPDQIYNKGIGWIKFTLSGSEVDSLTNIAPPEILRIQDALGDKVRSEGEIEQVSMEIARVDIERTWFHPELFKSRFWKWANSNQPVLSDEAQPWPKGILPGYIIGLVLVRNISIVLKTTDNTPTTAGTFRVLGNFILDSNVLNEVGRPIHVLPIPGERIFDPGNIDPRPDYTRIITPEVIRDMLETPELIRDIRESSEVIFNPSNLSEPESESSTNVTATSSTEDAVYLVAYIVQKTPKSPNPDPTLKWI